MMEAGSRTETPEGRERDVRGGVGLGDSIRFTDAAMLVSNEDATDSRGGWLEACCSCLTLRLRHEIPELISSGLI